ncbi:hypothetical protein BJ684DRAFT_18828 [Piptocephalis cylindrospora]|uniref:Uncharacterized protein n=1 Tax=Piptocephalis cylindrospora TaxID=1907219 RepID=A0A4P9Y8U3_9FUNG|nr:hypothetical protein BJ684DRAFT_18828 [Piptocephalis cylindrospora]|eukprot:RKP14801.1 hypothetical protein BJ684DRAFT_18828 [Piptocephalis cylindrospora]
MSGGGKEEERLKTSKSSEQPKWVSRVKQYILGLFRGDTLEGQATEEDGREKEALVGLSTEEEQATLLEAFIGFSERSRVESGTRRLCVTFLSWAIHIQGNPQAGPGSVGLHPILQATCQAIQATMLQPTSEKDMAALSRSLQLSLVPYFYVTLPQKGPLYGPFLDLSRPNQMKVLGMLWWLRRDTRSMEVKGQSIEDDSTSSGSVALEQRLLQAVEACLNADKCPKAMAHFGRDMLATITSFDC